MEREQIIQADVAGLLEVEQRVGRLPSFHDAEVIRIVLDREFESTLLVRTMAQKGIERPLDILFTFTGIEDLELADFSNQNVVSDLHLEKELSTWTFSISPLYGIGGYIKMSSIRISIVD